MDKKIIAIVGQSNKGKSETIKKIAQKLITTFPIDKVKPVNVDYSKDIKVVIEINGFKIGIESQGDPNSRLFESLTEFAIKKCDLIICATRTSGATVKAVEKLKDESYKVIWATNYRSSDYSNDDLNDISARQIVELIQKLSKSLM